MFQKLYQTLLLSNLHPQIEVATSYNLEFTQEEKLNTVLFHLIRTISFPSKCFLIFLLAEATSYDIVSIICIKNIYTLFHLIKHPIILFTFKWLPAIVAATTSCNVVPMISIKKNISRLYFLFHEKPYHILNFKMISHSTYSNHIL